MAGVRIYIALQEFANGEVNFRKWSPDCPRNLPGGPYQKQTIDAHLWIQRMVFRCAKEGISPVVRWADPLSVSDEFLRKIPPFDVMKVESSEEMEFLGSLRQGGFDDARFVNEA